MISLCADCGVNEVAHLDADECQTLGIDSRDGRGCAVRFSFDDPDTTFVGRTFGTRWNGFLNVTVSEPTLDAIIAAMRDRYAEEESGERSYWPDAVDGFVDLSGGYATIEEPRS